MLFNLIFTSHLSKIVIYVNEYIFVQRYLCFCFLMVKTILKSVVLVWRHDFEDNDTQHNNKKYDTQHRVLLFLCQSVYIRSNVKLSVVILLAIMLSVVILLFIMLNVVILSFIMLSVVIMSFIMLSVFFLLFITLNVVILIAILLSAINRLSLC